MANSGSNTVSVLDLVYFRPDRTLQVGDTPVALAVNPRRNEVYVLNAQPRLGGGSLSVIDTSRNQVVATIGLGRNPTALAVDPAGHRAYVVNTGGDSVSVVDLDRRSVAGTAATAAGPTGVRVAPDDRTLVVTNAGGGSVMLFSIEAKGVSGGAPLKLRTTIPGCPGAVSPVILPDSSKTFVACAGDHEVLAASLAAEPGSWNARQDATLLNDHLVAMLDVGPNPSNLTMKPDGGEVFASDGTANAVSEIATNTNEVGNTQAIGSRPGQGIISADGSSLWIANSGADSISLYSIDDGKLLAEFADGRWAGGAGVFGGREPGAGGGSRVWGRGVDSDQRAAGASGAVYDDAGRDGAGGDCGERDEGAVLRDSGCSAVTDLSFMSR